MPQSYQQLRTPVTEAQAFTFLMDLLASFGFRTGSWADGSVQKNVFTAIAKSSAGLGQVVSNLAYNLLENPNGDWLDLLGKYVYQLDRDPGIRAVRQAALTLPNSSQAVVIENGTQAKSSTVGFSVTGLGSPVVIAPGTSATFTFLADAVGVNGSTGVPPKVLGKGGVKAAWLGAPSVNGADREIDSRYLTRCVLKPSTMTYSVGLRAYQFWALTADPSVKRARAVTIYDDPDSVLLALDPGTDSQIHAVADYIAGRSPPRDVVTVDAVNPIPQAFKLRPIVNAGVTAAQLQTLLENVLALDMPIGGWHVQGDPVGYLLRERLTEALLCKNGAKSAGLITPATDVVLGSTDVIAPTWDIEVSYA